MGNPQRIWTQCFHTARPCVVRNQTGDRKTYLALVALLWKLTDGLPFEELRCSSVILTSSSTKQQKKTKKEKIEQRKLLNRSRKRSHKCVLLTNEIQLSRIRHYQNAIWQIQRFFLKGRTTGLCQMGCDEYQRPSHGHHVCNRTTTSQSQVEKIMVFFDVC